MPSNADILKPLTRCLICDTERLKPINEEELRHTQALTDPDVESILRPFDGRKFQLNRCPNCGFLQPEGLPIDPRYFDAIYDQKWSEDWMLQEFRSPYKDFIFNGILNDLEKRLSPSRRKLLDIGAHVGRMIHLATNRGWEAEGIELNEQTRQIAVRMTGRPVQRITIQDLVATEVKYDAVTLTDVLEHMPHPRNVLGEIRCLLKPGGWVSIKVPYGLQQLRKQQLRCWLGRVTKAEIATSFVHVNHFSPKALQLALTKAGFDRPTVKVGAPEFPPGRQRIAGLLDHGFRHVVYRLANLPGMVHSPLGLNLQAYATVSHA